MRTRWFLPIAVVMVVGGCADATRVLDDTGQQIRTAAASLESLWTSPRADADTIRDRHYRAGLSYMSGDGVPQDSDKAARYLRLAADEGHPEAQYLIAASYQLTSAGQTDEHEALTWFQRAADQGHAGAQFYLGEAYLNGLGVRRDEIEAAWWLRKAANQGHREAQFLLGSLCIAGVGVTVNYVEAMMWLSLAADEGHGQARLYRDAMVARLVSGDLPVAGSSSGGR